MEPYIIALYLSSMNLKSKGTIKLKSKIVGMYE